MNGFRAESLRPYIGTSRYVTPRELVPHPFASVTEMDGRFAANFVGGQ